jgi:CheY-like chemotaxis protein
MTDRPQEREAEFLRERVAELRQIAARSPAVSEQLIKVATALEKRALKLEHDFAKRLTVLVVDDDNLARDSIVSIVEAQGFRVLAAWSASEAMRILVHEHVDVLFTDIVMPDQDGIELAQQAKKLKPGLHLMFTTGYYSRAPATGDLGKLLFKPMRALEIEAALIGLLGKDAQLPRC